MKMTTFTFSLFLHIYSLTWKRLLRDAGCPEVDVLGGGVDGGVALDGLVGHHPQQVLPVGDGVQAAPLPPPAGCALYLNSFAKEDNRKHFPLQNHHLNISSFSALFWV